MQQNSNVNLLSIDTADNTLVSSRPLTVASHYHSEDSTVSIESESQYDLSDNLKPTADTNRNKTDCAYSLTSGETIRQSISNFQHDICNPLSCTSNYRVDGTEITAHHSDYVSDTKYAISPNDTYPLIPYNSVFPLDAVYHSDYNMNVIPFSDSQNMVSERNLSYQSRTSCLKSGLKSNTFRQYHFGSQLISGYTWLLTGNYDYINNLGMINHLQSNSYRMPHTRILTYNV